MQKRQPGTGDRQTGVRSACEFDIISDPKLGISRGGDIIDLATEYEIIKLGAFYSYGDLSSARAAKPPRTTSASTQGGCRPRGPDPCEERRPSFAVLTGGEEDDESE